MTRSQTTDAQPPPDTAANGSARSPEAEDHSASPLLRGLSILEAFLGDEETLSVGDLSRKLGLHKSTVSRFAGMLESAGYLAKAEGHGRYKLGTRLASLGVRASPQQDVREVARPLLIALRDECGETVHLGVREGIEVVTIDFVDGTHTIRMHTTIGKRSPVHCSAMGKAILALSPPEEVTALQRVVKLTALTPATRMTWGSVVEDLDATRERGYSIDEQELLVGLSCIGAPIVNRDGVPVAAISVSGPSDRVAATGRDWLAARVKRAADEISARM